MAKIIPREKIKHLEWVQGQNPTPQTHSVPSSPIFHNSSIVNIDNILNGQTFYNNTKNGGNYVGLPLALAEAEKFIEENGGVIATMPYLIAGKANAFNTDDKGVKTRDTNHYLWANWLTALTEEDIGIDTNGVYAPRGKSVLITLHGGGILTPTTITNAYTVGLTPQNAAKLEQDDITKFLQDGSLPSGDKIPIYRLDDLKRGISNPFERYAVVSEFDDVKSLESKQFQKAEFLANPLVLARAGTVEHLDTYFDLAKNSNGVGCYHRFKEIDPTVAQGRLLCLNCSYYGLLGSNDLNSDGRFVGVAPEAQGTKK